MFPEDVQTLTIARRTRKNLDYLYSQKAQGADVEEFTHLLNSMLGMIICLREEYLKEKTVTWEDLKRKNLKIVDLMCYSANPRSPQLKSHNSFSQLIRNMRHAFAHNCFTLLKNEKTNQIMGIRVWNIPPRKENKPENRIWETVISEQQLRDLAYLFINYIENEFAP
ncbi:MAG: hypothetical protein DYG89_21770 [Caldilinea sp. CFX5]|nr:hypothetical protein [Caldilinea sp. CFX5]